MVNLQAPELDRLFFALSDPTRRQILSRLNDGKQTVGALAEPFKISLAAISKHIKILEEATLLTREKKGRIHECELNHFALRKAEEALHFYTRFWNDQLDEFAHALESVTEADDKRETTSKSKRRK